TLFSSLGRPLRIVWLRATHDQICSKQHVAFLNQRALKTLRKHSDTAGYRHGKHQGCRQQFYLSTAPATPQPSQGPHNLILPNQAETISPEASSIRRSQRAARRSSWVIRIKVVPCSRLSSNSRSIIRAPVALSRLPVGSSANSMRG